MKLTNRESDVLAFIKAYIEQYERSPIIREIAAGVGLTAKSAVHKHLVRLQDKGLIDWEYNEIRSIRLVTQLNTEIHGRYLCDTR